MSNATAEKLERKRPVLKRASDLKKEFDSRSVKLDQKPPIVMPDLDEPFEREPDIILAGNDDIGGDQFDKLAFNEEAIEIIIHRSGEKFSPKTTDLIAVNGKHAEMLFRNGWVQIGYLPRGVWITTKRKYVEQLAHAKVDHIATHHEDANVERPTNVTERTPSMCYAFSTRNEKNPRGAAWLEELIRSQA